MANIPMNFDYNTWYLVEDKDWWKQIPENTPVLLQGPKTLTHGTIVTPQIGAKTILFERQAENWFPFGVDGYEYDSDFSGRDAIAFMFPRPFNS